MGAYAIAGLIGAIVGAAELIARYRDAPFKAVATGAALAYIVMNLLASLGALLLIHAFGWTFGAKDAQTAQAYQVLVASFGAVAFFRTSFFTIKAGDANIGIGPSVVLTSLLSAADRAVDRERGAERAIDVAKMMGGVSFAKAHEALPTFCLGLLQNVSAEDQAALRKTVDAIAGTQMDDSLKTLSLGLQLMNIAGRDVLDAAIKGLGDQIRA